MFSLRRFLWSKLYCFEIFQCLRAGITQKRQCRSAVFKRALKGLPLTIYGSGGQTRDFIYIDDLCNAILCGLDSGVGGEVFQIATFKENTVNRIAELVKEMVERDTDKSVEIVYEDKRAGEVTRSYSDISKAQSMIGYNPKIDLETGMAITWDWFKKYYDIGK